MMNLRPVVKKWFNRATAGYRMLPSVILIGVQKGGSTSIFNYLVQHPDILPPLRKQIHFFDRFYNGDINRYKQNFPLKRSGTYTTLDITPYYFIHPMVPERMARHLDKQQRFLLVLRDPVERAFSHYNMNVAVYNESRSFREVMEIEETLIKNEEEYTIKALNKYSWTHRRLSILSRGFYWKQLERWLNYFDKENFLIKELNELKNDPVSFMQEVETFFDLKPYDGYKFKVYNKGTGKQTVEGADKAELYKLFRADNLKLAEFTGKEFSWFENFYALHD